MASSKEISEDDFNQLMTDTATFYDRHYYLTALKLLYKDHLAMSNVHVERSKSVMNLLQDLTASGSLSSSNLTILYDTVKITKQFGFKSKVKNQPPENIKDHKVLMLTSYRQKLFQLGAELDEDEISILDSLHNNPVKRYQDSWSLIMDFEHRGIIDKDVTKMDTFLTALKANQMNWAFRIFIDDPELHETGIKPPSTNSEGKKLSPRDNDIKMFLKKELQDLYKNMNLMGTAVFGEEHKVDIADVFTDLTLLQSTKQKQVDQATREQEAKPTSLAKVLKIIKSKKSCKVILTGKGGMGKTTLLRYIAYNWAKGKDDTFSDKLLFLINIRDIEVGKTIIDSIVDQIDLDTFAVLLSLETKEDSVRIIKKFIVQHGQEIVILLDGLDELKKGVKNPLNLLKFRSNNNNTTLITSRPLNITTFVENCDVHVQVNGFSKESKKLYIEKYFKNNPELGEKLILKLKLNSNIDELERNSDLYDIEYSYSAIKVMKDREIPLLELCSSPLFLLVICSMCEQSNSFILSNADETFPITMSAFFEEFICCTLNQHTKVEGNKISKIWEIQDPYKKAILALGQCMFEGLEKENKLYIFKNEFDGITDKDTVELALKLGFVYKKASNIKNDRKAVFAPLHKLVSEALAGFYLANVCLSNEMNEEECKKMLLNPYLHMIIIFTIEFLGKDAGKIIKHWLKLKTAANYYSLAKCFSFVKPEHEIHVVIELPNISTDIVCEMRNVLPYDEAIENKHLVQLMNICYERFKENKEDIVDTLKKITKTKDTKPTETFCSMLVHFYIIIHGLLSDDYIDDNDCRLFELHSLLGESKIDTLSAEMENFQFKYRFRNIYFTSTNPKLLIHFLKFSSKQMGLNFKPCSITGDVLNHVIDQVNDISLEFKQIDLSDNDLSNISVGSLTMLMNITCNINLNNCQLSGGIFNALFKDQCKVMKVIKLDLKGNDLSDIDGVSLFKAVNLMFSIDFSMYVSGWRYRSIYRYKTFKWSDYSLSVDNLESLADACHEHGCMLTWRSLDLCGLNLGSIKGSKIAWLLQFSPKLCQFDLVDCNLSGTIIRDLLKECEVNKVILKPNMFDLRGTDLSEVDGVLLSKLINVMNPKFKWSDYSLPVGNLKSLADACQENGSVLNWKELDLSGHDLASIEGSTLACLLKFSPSLEMLGYKKCILPNSILSVINEWGKMFCNGTAFNDHFPLSLWGRRGTFVGEYNKKK